MLIIVGLLLLSALWLGTKYYGAKKENRALHVLKESQGEHLAKLQNKYEQSLLAINEAIVVVDDGGKVEFINGAAQRLTGWSQGEALGQPYQIIYKCAAHNGSEENYDPIGDAFRSGYVQRNRNHAILTSRAGQQFTISDRVSPIIDQDDQVIGALCVFRDMSRKEVQQSRISRLTFRDSLTGLYNRVFFDRELPRLDKPDHWPLSVMIGDLNGLKLTNDIFGHSVGDELLITVAQAFLQICRPEDRVFRWGGDEFVVLLPRTSLAEAQEIRERLQASLAGRAVGPMNLYLPIGCATKEGANQDFQVVWQQAEEEMYWLKTIGQSTFQKETLDRIVAALHSRSPAEKEHAKRVSKLAEDFGKFLGLSVNELRKLRLGGLLHDIGKIVLDPELLHKPYPLKPSEQHETKRHPLVGFRLLNFFEETADLAGDVLAHHEQWDGGGYPKGLKGDEIPYLGRILAIIETYDRVLFDPFAESFSPEQALALIATGAGKKFDPKLSKAFLEMMQRKSAEKPSLRLLN